MSIMLKKPYINDQVNDKPNLNRELKTIVDELETGTSHLRDLECQVREAKELIKITKEDLVRELVDRNMYDCLTVNMAMLRRHY